MGAMDWIRDINTFQERKVLRTEPSENGGIGVSTVFTSDEGYETALLDNNGAHPVERYCSRKEAVVGHHKWVRFSKSNKSVTKLGGLGGFVDDKEIELWPEV